MKTVYFIISIGLATVAAKSLEFTNEINGEICKLNQRYSDCATACPLSCGKKNFDRDDCPNDCSPGCECIDGYYLNKNLECVKPENCDPPNESRHSLLVANCGANQQFSFCRSPCPPSCGKKSISPCPFNCTSGCECLDGFFLNKNRECVKLEDCYHEKIPANPVCGVNETFNSCHRSCEFKCAADYLPKLIPMCVVRRKELYGIINGAYSRGKNWTAIVEAESKKCWTGCGCSDGFWRNSKGLCVKPENCFDHLNN
ncbi:von Willebrand factor [Microplitis demolitor]|uniref:von Willebrand factor n=1 Tax=Microplitis demolitor TaxID=69319 RepID=UPI0004CCF0FC|nr:von Willebrand factor [Microplitis demolitor]